ncbi:hypothetical protein ABEB36_000036 [Hypothenemus hampei]|uniref:Uncharacterized protein n=1 Tax=Hypothenemus hampei TaxID=57062 RepID=A0ABD1FBW4_HYPHA
MDPTTWKGSQQSLILLESLMPGMSEISPVRECESHSAKNTGEQLWDGIMEAAERFCNNPGIFQICNQAFMEKVEKCIQVQVQICTKYKFEHLLKT